MDKASASGAGDSRLESWAAQGYSENGLALEKFVAVPTLPEHRLRRMCLLAQAQDAQRHAARL